MKVMSTWSARPGAFDDAIERFLKGEAAPVEGVKLLGRWHSVDLSTGFSLYETDDPAALHRGALRWVDLLELQTYVVIEDAEAGANFAQFAGK
ncbi:DUF3303 domain-containing protein [Acidicapsa dinghuensis]|uniref:DUF3303 domain-containing protein n=1 Tax=Acidicapsa dinghuensis TaxID=2218256 RepID=A0ABW1E8S3_9BACT|nr:DUF3303 domain-containing protein [Acidicapsa dinghuensis]